MEGGGRVNQISEGRKLVKDGEIVRVCVDDDTHFGLPICLVESHSRNQGQARVLEATRDFETFRYIFTDMDMGTHNNSFFVYDYDM